MKTALSAFPIEFTVRQEARVAEDKEFKALKHDVAVLGDNQKAIATQVKVNSKSAAYLLDFFCAHVPYFDELDTRYTVAMLGALDGNQRRSLYSKISKTDAWTQNASLHITTEEFKEICEAAKRLSAE